jgi:hypothetical protein
MSDDIFKNLVTDITAQVLQQVQHQMHGAVAEAVNQRLESLINSSYIEQSINTKINNVITQYQPDMSTVEKSLRELTDNWAVKISADLDARVNRVVNDKVSNMDLTELVVQSISNKIDPTKLHYPFPEKSIDIAAIDTSSLAITGDQVTGGVVKNFGSTGIDDQATVCQVTILDHGTVFENTLYAPKIEIKGGAIIDGDLEIQGRIVDSPAYQQLIDDVTTTTKEIITDDVLAQHQNIIFDRILNEGIDISKITLNGRVIMDGNRLLGVVHSQLQSVGTLLDLQTSGDTLLSETVYAANKRVGINTMDPKTALSVWDEEIEIGIGKQQQGVARVSTERAHAMVLGSNGKDNVTLNADGSTSIPSLKLNNMLMTSSATPPSYDAAKGTVVFNENPTLGGPLGWVSLGDARWANFGIID